ncbi:BQ5605_C017g08497 [Microbotryum silenes-dioicae]|uniref:BQ5605_C017g08497 protein n=1 Tax=Microbotryum silenes-dioicae TaxID=796604 RepID=A0A2X0LUV5_9BASI|nr:BQ5605_C017g08497 [Microbotryum silenes-dioicae]
MATAIPISATPVEGHNDGDDFLAYLASNPKTNLVSSSQDKEQFDSLTGAFNQRLYTSATAIVTPTNAQAISSAVTFARQYNIPVTARGGGHSYAAYGVGNGNAQGLVIDLSHFSNIELKDDNRTVVVGGGVRLGDMALQLDEWGLAIAHGVCPFVGVGGHAAFGGFGYASRAWGLTLDHIIALDVVMADGTYLQGLTREQDPDLFWALCGAAPNFGIQTAYHFRAHEKPNNVVRVKYSYSNASPDMMTRAFLAFQAWGQESSPPNLGLTAVIGGGGSFEITGIYYGTGDACKKLMAPFEDKLPEGFSTEVDQAMSWIESLQALSHSQPLSTKGKTGFRDCFYAKSLMTPDSPNQLITTDAALAFFTYLQKTATTTNWFVEIDLYGGAGSAINAVPLNQSSFAHRSSLLSFQMYASSKTYGNPYPEDGFDFVSGMYDALLNPMKEIWGTSYGAYVNYGKSETLYWGSQYERLSTLRAKYDPTEVFKYPQAIRPSTSTT